MVSQQPLNGYKRGGGGGQEEEKSAHEISGGEREKYDLLIPC